MDDLKLTEFEQEVFEYLDALRESGATNMYGARPYIMRAFRKLSSDEATDLLSLWMQSFSDRHPRQETR